MSKYNKLQTYILKYSRKFPKLPPDHGVGLISQHAFGLIVATPDIRDIYFHLPDTGMGLACVCNWLSIYRRLYYLMKQLISVTELKEYDDNK